MSLWDKPLIWDTENLLYKGKSVKTVIHHQSLTHIISIIKTYCQRLTWFWCRPMITFKISNWQVLSHQNMKVTFMYQIRFNYIITEFTWTNSRSEHDLNEFKTEKFSSKQAWKNKVKMYWQKWQKRTWRAQSIKFLNKDLRLARRQTTENIPISKKNYTNGIYSGAMIGLFKFSAH